MKRMKTILAVTAMLLIESCGTKTLTDDKTEGDSRVIQSWEIIDGDTVNGTDLSGRKQGHWRIGYGSGSAIESGDFLDNKKQGYWHYYDSTGKINRVVWFKNDTPIPQK